MMWDTDLLSMLRAASLVLEHKYFSYYKKKKLNKLKALDLLLWLLMDWIHFVFSGEVGVVGDLIAC